MPEVQAILASHFAASPINESTGPDAAPESLLPP
jgi:hypothetical protein